MCKEVCKRVWLRAGAAAGSYIIKGAHGHDLNFEPPFKRVRMLPALEDALGVTLPQDLRLVVVRLLGACWQSQ